MSNKHYTFSKEILYILNSRDREKYPTEAALIKDALIHHAYDSDVAGMKKDLRHLHAKVEELCRLQRMNIRLDAKEGKYFEDFPGGLEDVEGYLDSLQDPRKYQLPSDIEEERKEFPK